MEQKLTPACIGIDLGSWTSKICVAKRGGVEIITNQANFRQTPSVVGFGLTQRNIGQAGNIKMKSNFRDTIVSPMRYLGLDSQYPLLKAQTKYTPCRTNINNGRIMFDVNQHGKPQQFTAQQIAAAYLTKMKDIIALNKLQSKEVVISVPTYLTQIQRKAFLDAAKIADLKITRLLNDSSAIALDYGMFRKSQMSNHPRNVLFIDFGHSKFGTFVCEFKKQQINVLGQQYSRNLGCRDIDYIMYQFYRGVFEKKCGNDIAQNRKSSVKLMQYIEKQRKILSGNSEHQLNIQCLMEEDDLQYTMTRQQFQKIATPIFKQIKNILTNMKKYLIVNKINLHSIELVGSGTRIPFLINTVKQIFSMQPSRTLNSSQSVARGCALMAAIKSSNFKLSNYQVKVLWNFVHGNQHLGSNPHYYPQKQSKIIYHKGQKIPNSKNIQFNRRQSIQILVQYQPPLVGLPSTISYILTQPQYPKHYHHAISFNINVNQNGLIVLESCDLVEQFYDETQTSKIGQRKTFGQPNFKKGKRQTFTPINYQINTPILTSEIQIQHFKKLEIMMIDQDKQILQTYEKKNQLESILYVWKEKLTGGHREFIEQSKLSKLLKNIEENTEWLYAEGKSSTLQAYVEKINQLRDEINLVQMKYNKYNQITDQIKHLNQSLINNLNWVNSTDQKYRHIEANSRQQAINLIQNIQRWLKNVEKQLLSQQKWEQFSITVDEIIKYKNELNQKVKQIMTKPITNQTQYSTPQNQKIDIQQQAV